MAVIFGLSSLSSLPPVAGGLSDKAAHALEYFGLAALTIRALARGSVTRVRLSTATLSLVIVVLHGLLDEAHQLFVPGRYFDLRDVAADAIGGFVAAAAIGAWGIIRRFSVLHRGRA
jgi:VanZ family protein